MTRKWWERVVESVADRGRELLNRRPDRDRTDTMESLCAALLSERGEASGIAIARDVVRRYERMDAAARAEFLEMLHRRFGPDPQAIQRAAEHYRKTGDLDALLSLTAAVEPPRQELFRRLNMAPRATAVLVDMRSRLLKLLAERPYLRAVDADLRHLLASWFNRGFLRLERIDWHTSAVVLEKLINYETVHEIQGWDDLRRRLERDRRCFAFMHPALPDEPLIFVEVALVHGMPGVVQPLIDPKSPVVDPYQADSAIFYSINNTLDGLRGISFGNFLIKQVVSELSAEFPRLKTFATLSPLPRFASTLRAAAEGRAPELVQKQYAAVLAAACESTEANTPVDMKGLIDLAGGKPDAGQETVSAALQALALAYLALPQAPADGVIDPVARFHLSNGARLEQINVFADTSAHGMRSAFGVMVNYLYDPDSVEQNHERFVGRGEIPMSRALTREYKALRSVWTAAGAQPPKTIASR